MEQRTAAELTHLGLFKPVMMENSQAADVHRINAIDRETMHNQGSSAIEVSPSSFVDEVGRGASNWWIDSKDDDNSTLYDPIDGSSGWVGFILLSGSALIVVTLIAAFMGFLA